MLGDRLEYTDSLVRHLWACVTMLAGVGFEDGRCTDAVSGQDGDFVSMGHQLGTIMCVAAYVLLVILSYQTFRLTSKRKKHIKCSGVYPSFGMDCGFGSDPCSSLIDQPDPTQAHDLVSAASSAETPRSGADEFSHSRGGSLRFHEARE